MSFKGKGKKSIQVGRPEISTQGVEELPPMPDEDILNRQLLGVLDAMNIPKAKAAQIMQQPSDKKWQLVWGQMKTQARHDPSHYLDQLLVHIESIEKQMRKKSKGRKIPQGLDDEATILRGLEISLRTNSLSWVKDFINYQPAYDERDKSAKRRVGGLNIFMEYFALQEDFRHVDSNYLCVLCLRALMNNAYGFTSVMAHHDTMNYICLCLGNIDPFQAHHEEGSEYMLRKYRTHILVLELLAAVCLVPKGHQRVLDAFNNFQKHFHERVRFLTLMHLLKTERHNIGVAIACMAFVNVVVHSVPDMNFQVALQQEFTNLGLMQLIEELAKNSAPSLTEQIDAYQDNFVNVTELAREARAHEIALRDIESLNYQLQELEAKANEDEERYTEAIADLHRDISEKQASNDALTQRIQEDNARFDDALVQMNNHVANLNEEISNLKHKLSTANTDREQLKSQLEVLEEQLQSGASVVTSVPATTTVAPNQIQASNTVESEQNDTSSTVTQVESKSEESATTETGSETTESEAKPTPSSAAPPPPPPPPPPPAFASNAPPPPPPPGLGAPGGDMAGTPFKAKKRVQLDVKLPMLNWVPLPSSRVRDTVFLELDDEDVIDNLDWDEFKQAFRIDRGGKGVERTKKRMSIVDMKPKGPMSVLDSNRARNLAIAQRRVGTNIEEIRQAIDDLACEKLPAEIASTLRNQFIATDDEMKLLETAEKSNKRMAEIDEFVLQMTRIPRVNIRLNLISLLDVSPDAIKSVIPQSSALITASNSLMNSKKLRRVLEIILAFGNYMNSQRRGAAFGFKMSVTDRLIDTKTRDRKRTLMNYVVEVIENQYSQVQDFMKDLLGLTKASQVSLATLEADVHVLEQISRAVEVELSIATNHPVLLNWKSEQLPKVEKARKDFADAKAAFKKCATYFAEPNIVEPSTFFAMFIRLGQAFEIAKKENKLHQEWLEKMRKLEEEQRLKEQALLQQADAAEEPDLVFDLQDFPSSQHDLLPRKSSRRFSKSVSMLDKVEDGDIDGIISDMKTNAYRRPDFEYRKREIGDTSDLQDYASARPWLK